VTNPSTPTGRARRRVIVVDNSVVARRVGSRIRMARVRAGLTQADVAKGRYTAAYISALERGLAKPSMAALTYIAERLAVPVRSLVGDDESGAARIEADLLLASGRWAEALDAYTALADKTPATDRGRHAELLLGIAEALCRLSRAREAIRPASEAAEAFAALGRPVDAAWARYWLAYAHYQQDDTAEARSLLQELLAAERGGLRIAPDFRFRVLTALAHVEAWERNTERALGYMEEARALTPGLPVRQRAAFLAGLALEYRRAGDLEASIRTGFDSLALYRAADAELEEASLENNLALTYLQLGNMGRADEHARRAADLAQRHQDTRLASHVAETQAQIAWAAGDRARAEERLGLVFDLVERGGSRLAAADAHLTQARIARQDGDPEKAAEAYGLASEILRAHDGRRLQDALGEWADLAAETGDLTTATNLYAEALGRRRRVPDQRVGTGAGEH
jgi:transcriptional regulator with XRE-family HTH domain